MKNILKAVDNAIGQDDLSKAICILSNIVVNQNYKNECLAINRKISSVKLDQLRDVESREVINREKNRISIQLNEIKRFVKDDYAVVVDFIKHSLKTESDFSEAYRIVSMTFNESTVSFIGDLNREIDRFQDQELEYGEEDESLNKFLELFEISKESLEERISESNFYDGHDIDNFITSYLCGDNFKIEYQIAKPTKFGSDISPYYNDIIVEDENVKRHLLIWEEKFLIGDYKSAYQSAEYARIKELGIKSKNYEYSLLSFVNKVSFDKIISEAVRKKERRDFDYTMLLFQRVLNQPDSSSTKSQSISYITQELTKSIKKIYNNIDFSYLEEELSKGQSRKRNYVKNIITISIEIFERIPNEYLKSLNLGLEILVELDGVNKYPWIKIINSETVNRTNLEAIELRSRLVDILIDNQYGMQGLYDNSYNRLKSSHNQAKKNRESYWMFRDKFLEEFKLLNILYSQDESNQVGTSNSQKRDDEFEKVETTFNDQDHNQDVRKVSKDVDSQLANGQQINDEIKDMSSKQNGQLKLNDLTSFDVNLVNSVNESFSPVIEPDYQSDSDNVVGTSTITQVKNDKIIKKHSDLLEKYYNIIIGLVAIILVLSILLILVYLKK